MISVSLCNMNNVDKETTKKTLYLRPSQAREIDFVMQACDNTAVPPRVHRACCLNPMPQMLHRVYISRQDDVHRVEDSNRGERGVCEVKNIF